MLKRAAIVLTLFLAFFSLLLANTSRHLSALSRSLSGLYVRFLAIGAVLLLCGFFFLWRENSRKGRLGLVGLALVAAWLGLNVLVFVYQDQLLFSPRSLSEARRARVAVEYPLAEELYVPGADGNVLHGWVIPGEVEKAPLILVFPGQGSEVSRYLDLSRQVPEFSWAFFNYRGYGLSEGIPSERGLFTDAVALYDWLVAEGYADPGKVFALGGSLGTGVASYLASQRPLRGVVLFSPYDKIGGGVAQDLIPLAATGPLLRNKFHVSQFAPQIQAPVLALVGNSDLVIGPVRSEKLLANWGGETVIHRLEADHYTIYQLDESWQAVRSFLFDLL